MNEAAHVANAATALLQSYQKQIEELRRLLEASRSLTANLEEEAHACSNYAHHRGWWHTHQEDL